nr:MAG TPA: hypothetical protein [Caudoviricetes sp.]
MTPCRFSPHQKAPNASVGRAVTLAVLVLLACLVLTTFRST